MKVIFIGLILLAAPILSIAGVAKVLSQDKNKGGGSTSDEYVISHCIEGFVVVTGHTHGKAGSSIIQLFGVNGKPLKCSAGYADSTVVDATAIPK